MSYMRDPHYVYRTTVRDDEEVTPGEYINVDGAYWDLDTFDELVVMRLAEMTVEETFAAIDRAVGKHKGNFGCDALCVATGFLPPVPHSSEKIESVLLPLFEKPSRAT